MKLCTRVSSRLLSALFLLLTPAIAPATSVNLIWTDVNLDFSNTSLVGFVGNTVTFDGPYLGYVVLTLDVQLDIDSRGVSAAFLTFDFDTDLDNEFNLLSWEELSWSNGTGDRKLQPSSPGIDGSQESTGTQAGTIFEFDGTSTGTGPANTTLTFARLVFTWSYSDGFLDGDDIFSSGLILGNATGSTISDAIFGSAGVTAIPEPGTFALLGLGVGCIALSRARRGRASRSYESTR